MGSVRAVSAPAPVDGLDSLLSTRLRRGPTGGGLERRTATVLLDCDDAGAWTVELERGRAGVRRGAPSAWTLRVRTSPAVLADVVSGRTSAVLAFADGRLAVRGDLSLAMALDGLFGAEPADDRPRVREVEAMGVRTSYLEAGPADAPPVVLLHGLGATGASMLPVLTDLLRDHRVLAPDAPGLRRERCAPCAVQPGVVRRLGRGLPAGHRQPARRCSSATASAVASPSRPA